MIQTLKEHPDYSKMGMIASHLGVVRETSLNGDRVKGIEVIFDKDAINKIILKIKQMPGLLMYWLRHQGVDWRSVTILWRWLWVEIPVNMCFLRS